MDLAKDILDVAEKVGQAPGLAIASSIVTSILKTVETSKNNASRLRSLAHSLASQIIDISENMTGKWDDAPRTLKRVMDEYEAFLLEMLNSITRLSQYSRLRAFLLAGECEREITRLEKRIADVRSTVTMLIGMNISVAVNEVQTSLLHSSMRHIVDGARLPDLEPDMTQMAPDFSPFTREDFLVTKTVSRQKIYDAQCRDAVTVNFYQAERCSNGRAILIKTFEGNDPGLVRSEFRKELEMNRKTLNPALLQIIGWSSAASKIPFHVYHAPRGTIEPFWTWAERTVRSNPVEMIFGLYDMRHSIKELLEFGQSRHLGFWNMGVVNIQHRGDRPQFEFIHTGRVYNQDLFDDDEKSFQRRYDYCMPLKSAQNFGRSTPSDDSMYDILPAARLASMFVEGAKDWLGNPQRIETLFKGRYDTIDALHLGPALLEAGWLSKSFMRLKPQGSVRLGDVGYIAQDGHFEVVANLHTRLVSQTGGLSGWTCGRSNRKTLEYEVVTHSEKLYRCHQHVLTPAPRARCSTARTHCLYYTDIDEQHAWRTLQEEAFRIIESNHLSIAPYDLQLLTSVMDSFPFWIGRGRDWIPMVEPTEQNESPPDSVAITIYEFQQEDILSVLESGVPELNLPALYSFKENPDGVDPTIFERHPETGDILVQQDSLRRCEIEFLQLPFGVTRPSGIEEIPD